MPQLGELRHRRAHFEIAVISNANERRAAQEQKTETHDNKLFHGGFRALLYAVRAGSASELFQARSKGAFRTRHSLIFDPASIAWRGLERLDRQSVEAPCRS